MRIEPRPLAPESDALPLGHRSSRSNHVKLETDVTDTNTHTESTSKEAWSLKREKKNNKGIITQRTGGNPADRRQSSGQAAIQRTGGNPADRRQSSGQAAIQRTGGNPADRRQSSGQAAVDIYESK